MSRIELPEGLATDSEGSMSGDLAGTVQADAAPAHGTYARVPDAIERNYLRVDDRYFFPDRTLAFIDEGHRIRVGTENLEVLRNVVAIAQARGWQAISLRGTEAFRQNLWREATLRGIEVQGYEPMPAEIQQLHRMQVRRHPSRGAGQRPAAPDSGPDPGQQFKDGPRSREGSRPTIQGLLVAAGAAPYRFDATQRMSFYATVRSEAGERTVWGADLERALAESASRPRLGDEVVLRQEGTHPVKIRDASRDMAGDAISEKTLVVQRARWRVETADHLRAMKRHAEHVRTGGPLFETLLRQEPGLAAAGAALELAAQYARRVTTDRASQQGLMHLIRERMADALEQGRSIRLPARRPRAMPMQGRARGGRALEEPSHERS